MRGKPNTQSPDDILRKGETKPLTISLMRAVIKIQSVKSKMIEPGYGYIRITQFQEQTGENLTKAIDKLYKESTEPMKGLVLDLRNDPGGLLNGAVAVSAAFLPANALVVYTDGRTDDAKMRLKASPEFYRVIPRMTTSSGCPGIKTPIAARRQWRPGFRFESSPAGGPQALCRKRPKTGKACSYPLGNNTATAHDCALHTAWPVHWCHGEH
jgi:hypothetical protein